MNQEVPTRVAITGVAAFAWNDRGYDADLVWQYAASEVAGGDDRAPHSLLVFFDTQHLAPTFGSHPWQEQAPALKAAFDGVRAALEGGNEAARQAALSAFVDIADDFARAPASIRAATVDHRFVEQSRPWLDAMQVWGRVLQLTAAGLDAANRREPAATRYFAEAQQLATAAAAIPTIKGAIRFDGLIQIADSVLDRFVTVT
ncbi:hypothetical protein ATB93_18640 [Sphingomonas sp. WG]|nr:hypothetical protein ATB93_18640 [Sphingomonas sp. WG]